MIRIEPVVFHPHMHPLNHAYTPLASDRATTAADCGIYTVNDFRLILNMRRLRLIVSATGCGRADSVSCVCTGWRAALRKKQFFHMRGVMSNSKKNRERAQANVARRKGIEERLAAQKADELALRRKRAFMIGGVVVALAVITAASFIWVP
ncbi:MAG: hypothetical protein LBC13_03275 [Clostridiales bacterium]|jgi:hypothetical protein|nr:hypothetical protein [Clostridiales bacterium]